MTPEEALTKKIKSIIAYREIRSNLIVCSDLEESEYNSICNSVLMEGADIEFNLKPTSKNLFNFLRNNKSSIIRFNSVSAVEILKSKRCLRILEGAVCSSPDSGQNWSVSYEGEESFMFSGCILMHIPKGIINWKLEKYRLLLRDQVVIKDLEEYACRLALLLEKYQIE